MVYFKIFSIYSNTFSSFIFWACPSKSSGQALVTIAVPLRYTGDFRYDPSCEILEISTILVS